MEDRDDSKCKVVFVGESEVGKHSIISKYISNPFMSPLNHTSGANFVEKNVYFKEYYQNIRFEIWDIAGQEKFRPLAKVFYKDASVCILVYDITRSRTFKELKNFWIKNIVEKEPADASN